MLPVGLSTVRLYLHLLAATIWVGGQLTLAGLLPVLRAAGPDVPRQAARRFNTIAWAAFVVLVVTGIWNVLAIDVGDRSTEYMVTLAVKVLVVVVSGFSAAVHITARSRAVLAVGGAVAGLSALGALFLGVQLHG